MFFQNVTHLVCTAVKLITQAKLSIGRPMSLPSVSKILASLHSSAVALNSFRYLCVFASLCLCVKTLRIGLCFLCASAVQSFCISLLSLCLRGKNAFALSSNLLLATCDCHFGGSLPRIRRVCISGGHTRDSRGIGVISAPSAVPPAMQKCRFSGFSRASRPPLQRENCSLCSLRIKKVS